MSFLCSSNRFRLDHFNQKPYFSLKLTTLKKIYLTLICLGMFILNAAAQDTHYWAQEYGPAGFLTPGAAVALTRDSGVLYFNPALLAHNTKNSASISGSVYTYNSLKIKNGAGDGHNLTSTNISIIPVVATGVIAFKGSKRFSIGYAIIHNPIINFNATQQRDARFNVLDDSYSPGNEEFIGQYSIENSVSETSGLLSTGFKVSPNFSLGFSAQGLFHNQHYNESYSGRALYNVGNSSVLPPIANSEFLYKVNHYNAGVNFKLGLAYDVPKHHLGLTITSPLAKLKGNGEILSDNITTDLRLSASDTINLLASTRQTKLRETWKMPLSIAAGYAYDFNRGQIYFSSEYFMQVNDYNIITPRDEYFIRSDVDDSKEFTSSFVKFKDARQAVVNFGLGLSYLLTADVTGYLSARTDFTYANKNRYKDDDGYISNTSNYNIYHWQIGGNFKKRKFNLRTGLLFSYGHTANFSQPINLTNPHESNFLQGETHNTPASYFAVGLMFAYIHNL